MAYVTAAVVRRRARITFADRTDADITDIVAYTDAVIDARLAKRYGSANLPFSPVPEVIEMISRDMAASILIEERPDFEEGTRLGALASGMRKRADALTAEIVEGRMDLGATGESDAGALSSTYDVDSDTATDAQFNRGNPLDWKKADEYETLDEDIEERR